MNRMFIRQQCSTSDFNPHYLITMWEQGLCDDESICFIYGA